MAGRCRSDAVLYAFPQNDKPKLNGDIPAEGWFAAVIKNAGGKVVRVKTPSPHKDLNDWTRAGATGDDLWRAVHAAKVYDKPRVGTADVDSGVRGKIIIILRDSQLNAASKQKMIEAAVVDALRGRGRFFFDLAQKDFAGTMYFDGERKELCPIQGDYFLAWLSQWTCLNRIDKYFRNVHAAVETEALVGKSTKGIEPEAFWARRPGATYLSNGDGRMVKITGSEIRETDNGEDDVLFAAGRTLAPWKLTDPRDPFETCSAFKTVSSAPTGQILLQLWLYSLPSNTKTKPPLCLVGAVGAGKTRVAKAIAELYGLPFRANKIEENGESNFWPSVDQGGLAVFDNADTRVGWLADALSAAATDGCSHRRRLYSNGDTVTLRARSWIVLTSANPTFANDPGLADRLLVVRMSRRTGQTNDSELTDEILAHRNAGLSFIAETWRKALADTGAIPPALNSRHPDFAAFAVRLGRALGQEAEAIAALQNAEADKSIFCLENDNIGLAILTYLQSNKTFTGTAADLLEKLISIDPDLTNKVNAKSVGKRLVKLWPHLEKVCQAERQMNRACSNTFTFKLP